MGQQLYCNFVHQELRPADPEDNETENAYQALLLGMHGATKYAVLSPLRSRCLLKASIATSSDAHFVIREASDTPIYL